MTIFRTTWARINSKSKAAVVDEQNGHSSSEDEKVSKSESANTVTISSTSKKFYKKRRYLFSKYDQGIKLDEESWYSVTPESVGEYVAERINATFPGQEVNVLDAFAGCGGNIIQFGKICNQVFGCEIDETKISY